MRWANCLKSNFIDLHNIYCMGGETSPFLRAQSTSELQEASRDPRSRPDSTVRQKDLKNPQVKGPKCSFILYQGPHSLAGHKEFLHPFCTIWPCVISPFLWVSVQKTDSREEMLSSPSWFTTSIFKQAAHGKESCAFRRWPTAVGAVPALPVFLACINRGEFCKALSTSSEVKCGRGATKQNKKQHQDVKKKSWIIFLNHTFFPWQDCLNVSLSKQPAIWREVCGLQGKLGHSLNQYHNLLWWMHQISGWLLTVCVWRRLHRTGVAMLGVFFL